MKRIITLFILLSILLFSCVTDGYTGTMTRSKFIISNDGINDSNLIDNGGLALGIREYGTVKLFGDSLTGVENSPISPEINFFGSDTVCYFYADTLMKGIYSKKYRILENGLTSPDKWNRFCDADVSPESYLHIDNGSSGSLASFVRKAAGNKKILRVHNGNSFLDIDSANTSGWLFSSQCHMDGDTFLVAYSTDMSSVKIRKIYSHGIIIQNIAGSTIATGIPSPGESIMNCSVAFDGKNAIVVSWCKGTPTNNKYLNFRFCNRSLATGPSDTLGENISDNSYYYYDDVSMVSYADNKFALVFWNSKGLFMSQVELVGNSIAKSTGLLASGNTITFCAAAANKKYLMVVCKGDLNKDGIIGIEGIRYPITNAAFGQPQNFSFSSTDHSISTLDAYSTAINCIIDTTGMMGITWKHKESIQGSFFAYRGIRFSRGFWTSPVESLNVDYGDSIRYYPITLSVSPLNSWSVEDSIRMGSTVQQVLSSPWISFSNANVLDSRRTVSKHFQYRIAINRKNGSAIDSLSTPIISDVTIPWNVKPQIMSLDSLSIRNRISSGLPFGSALTVLSRYDTVKAYIKIRDQDQGDQVSCKGSWPATDSVQLHSGASVFTSAITFLPTQKDTSVLCSLSVWDFLGWNAQPKTFSLISRNAIPQLNCKFKISGKNDTLPLNDTILRIQENDSVEFFYSVSDTNDQTVAKGIVYRKSGNLLTPLDSTKTLIKKRYVVRGDTLQPVDSLRLIIAANDPDTMVQKRVTVLVNHSPKILSLSNGLNTIYYGDTIRLKSGHSTTINIHIKDTDLVFWDSIHCIIATKSFIDSVNSKSGTIPYVFTPSYNDSEIVIYVFDKSGKSDTFKTYVKMPWLATDSLLNPGFRKASDTLTKYISLIAGNFTIDSVTLPLINKGNDSMQVLGCKVKSKDNQWLRCVILNDTISSTDSFNLGSIVLEPGMILNVKFLVTAKLLSGDSITEDTVFVFTDDPSHATIAIPVRIEYNDLPRIVDIQTNFIADVPYQKLKKTKAVTPNSFPPHASIQIFFSEPIDSLSAMSGISIYSVFDQKKTGTIDPIHLKYVWSQNYTKVDLYADYLKQSSAFGFKPPSGLFIPTDSLVLRITNAVHDRATTPHGPSGLDIHRNYQIYSAADTLIRKRVDSVTFTLLGVHPVAGDTNVVTKKPEIELTFSAPVYARTVDTSMNNNQTLIVRSKYNDYKQLSFDSIYVTNEKVTFRIAQRLFYCDSIYCLYNSASIRNSSGFSVDNNKNGIPIADYDSTSTEDNVSWKYRLKNNYIVSVSPENKSSTDNVSPSVKITFSDPVYSGTFDTDTSNKNKSIRIGSMYSSGYSTFSSIRYSSDSLQVTVQPTLKFFSSDSVYCHFTGFSSKYLYNSVNNYPDGSKNAFSGNEWYFLIGNTGFYTYPNPYRSGKGANNCKANGLCGIWFKNLHVLKKGNKDVKIRIFDMNANPVFDSGKRGGPIHFETGSSTNTPEWLWNTNNMSGEPVASGLYMYVIYDLDGNILIKDKLIIVR